jgi:hypothetical protein
MAKYRFLRDRAANGRISIPSVISNGMMSPSWLPVTKQYKKGDVVDGTIATKDNPPFTQKGDFLIKASSGVTSNGKPYSGGEVELSTTIYDTRDGIKTYWMEELDSNGNPIKTSVFTPKNIMITLAVVIVLGLIIKK